MEKIRADELNFIDVDNIVYAVGKDVIIIDDDGDVNKEEKRDRY